jgi:putative transposase
MLIVKKQGKLLELPIRLFESGILRIKSVSLECYQDNEDIINKTWKILEIMIILFKKKGKSVMLEYLPRNKWKTLQDKKIFLKTDSLIMTWCQMLVLELTGKEKDFKPFWTDAFQNLSQKLWLPIETGCVDSPLNCSNQSLKNVKSNSWFLMNQMKNQKIQNYQTTFSPLFMSIPVGRWEKEDTPKKILTRTKKTRIILSKTLSDIFKKILGVRRYVYNKVLDKTKKGEKKNFFELRDKYVTKKYRNGTVNPNVEDWETDIPSDIREGAIKDLMDAYTSSFSNLKNGNISKFNMAFCKKKSRQSFSFPLSAISVDGKKEVLKRSDEELENAKKKSCKDTKISETRKRVVIDKNEGGFYLYKKFYKDIYEKEKIKIKKRNLKKPIVIEKDSRILYENGAWYLLSVYNVNSFYENPIEDFCALDPGVRTFQTVYSESSITSFEIKKQVVKKLLLKLDELNTQRSKKSLKLSKIIYREQKYRRKLDNLINDIHYKTCNWLTKTYDTIHLPTFETQEIAKKSRNKNMNRILMLMKHYKFKSRLISKCEERRRQFVSVTEEFTSKTCGRCGFIKKDLGYNKIFKCDKCGLEIDRDYNGARNIFMKSMIQNKSVFLSYNRNMDTVQ